MEPSIDILFVKFLLELLSHTVFFLKGHPRSWVVPLVVISVFSHVIVMIMTDLSYYLTMINLIKGVKMLKGLADGSKPGST